jgi:xanthine dehydrogenase accessory factor
MRVSFHQKVLEWAGLGKRVAIVTVVGTVGSTPRKPGAKMLVSSDLDLYGTIGGGCVEADAILAARDVLRSMVPRLLRIDIKAKNADEMDMLCGGEITLFVEPVMPDFKLLICGGGHIAQALAHVAKGLDFRITVLDDRPQFSHPERFPTADETIAAPFAELGERVPLTRETFAVIVTRGHTGDEVCLRQILNSPACFIAMVGSRSKWANIRARLKEEGISKSKLDRVHSPAGLDIGSVTPEEIAISIIAQVVQERARMLREGLSEPPVAQKTAGKSAKGTKARISAK